MKIYLGAVEAWKEALQKFDLWKTFKPRRGLASFHYKKQIEEVEENTSDYDDIFIDSGAFSFMFSVFKDVPEYWKKAEFKDYLNSYIAWLHKYKNKVEVYANLDVIGNAKETWKIQKFMEAEGLKPLPVFHLTDTTHEYLDRYIEQYEYMAVGGAVKVGGDFTAAKREAIVREVVHRVRQIKPELKIHAFGITGLAFLKEFELYSCDSVSWAMGAAYGNINFLTEGGSQIVLRISDRSKNDIKQENRVSDREWEVIIAKLESLGFTIDQIKSDFYVRRAVNAVYYIELERYLNEWYGRTKKDRKFAKRLF